MALVTSHATGGRRGVGKLTRSNRRDRLEPTDAPVLTRVRWGHRVIGWLLATMGTALLGSVVPVVNIELYLIGVLSVVHGLSWWALALAATFGQLAGKTLFFYAGRGSVSLGERLGRMTRLPKGGRTARWLERFHRETKQRPWWARAVLFVGAVTGIPPFTVMAFVCGTAGMRLLSFLGVSFVGRTAHFLAVAGAPELVRQLPLITG